MAKKRPSRIESSPASLASAEGVGIFLNSPIGSLSCWGVAARYWRNLPGKALGW